MKPTLVALFLLCFPFCSFAGDGKTITGEVRDSSGKLIYKTYTKGSVTETRNPSGKLVTKSTVKNGRTEVRSSTGKLLYKLK